MDRLLTNILVPNSRQRITLCQLRASGTVPHASSTPGLLVCVYLPSGMCLLSGLLSSKHTDKEPTYPTGQVFACDLVLRVYGTIQLMGKLAESWQQHQNALVGLQQDRIGLA